LNKIFFNQNYNEILIWLNFLKT